MRIAYLDESGTPDLTGSTSHFVLLALAIDGESWKQKDAEIARIKARFGMENAEIHAGWLARRYPEQERVAGFEALGAAERRASAERERDAMLFRRATLRGVESLKEAKKNFRKTAPYLHLTLDERRSLLRQVVTTIAAWADATLFAECIDKRTFGGVAPKTPPFEEAFDQVVTRFHRHLESLTPRRHGFLVQDRNETMAVRLTDLMRQFHERGTRWTAQIPLLIETPLFVDSRLTSLVQVADVCAYSLRRYLENDEADLFDTIFPRFHRSPDGRCVGVRHYRGARPCACRICAEH